MNESLGNFEGGFDRQITHQKRSLLLGVRGQHTLGSRGGNNYGSGRRRVRRHDAIQTYSLGKVVESRSLEPRVHWDRA